MITKDGKTIGEVQKRALFSFFYKLFTEIENSNSVQSSKRKSKLDKGKILLLISIPDSEIWQSQRVEFRTFIREALKNNIPDEHILILPETECTYHYLRGVKEMDPGPVKILDLGHTSFSITGCSAEGGLQAQDRLLLGGNRIEAAALENAIARYNAGVGLPMDWDDIPDLRKLLVQVRRLKEEYCRKGKDFANSFLNVKNEKGTTGNKIEITKHDFDVAFTQKQYMVSQPGFPETKGTYLSLIQDFVKRTVKNTDRVILTGGMSNAKNITDQMNRTLEEVGVIPLNNEEEEYNNKWITEGGIACVRNAFRLEQELRKFECEVIPGIFKTKDTLTVFAGELANHAGSFLWDYCYKPAFQNFEDYPTDIRFGTCGDDPAKDVSLYCLLYERLAWEILKKYCLKKLKSLEFYRLFHGFCDAFQSEWEKCSGEICGDDNKNECQNIILSHLRETIIPEYVDALPDIVSQCDLSSLLYLSVNTGIEMTSSEREKWMKRLRSKQEAVKAKLRVISATTIRRIENDSKIIEKISGKLTDYLLEQMPLD
ncbi:MAG: hypothetical protein LUD01_00470 [Clostridiales bacterium]|nr:hypothetical protein [Clostridiales bacterium]